MIYKRIIQTIKQESRARCVRKLNSGRGSRQNWGGGFYFFILSLALWFPSRTCQIEFCECKCKQAVCTLTKFYLTNSREKRKRQYILMTKLKKHFSQKFRSLFFHYTCVCVRASVCVNNVLTTGNGELKTATILHQEGEPNCPKY